MITLFLFCRRWTINPEVVSFAEASFGGLRRAEQEEEVFAFRKFAGRGPEEARPYFDGIELPHGFRFELGFRTWGSHFDFAAVFLPVHRKQGDVFHRLAF